MPTEGLPTIPQAISDQASLHYFARKAVEGTLTGVHRSSFFGSSAEFAEHKPYSIGDDKRAIDWKVYGRADRYFIKRFEDETNLRAYLVLDASGSMNYGSIGYTKWNYTAVLAATLAYLFVQQNDLVSLLLFGDGEPRYIPPRGRMRHFQLLSETLQRHRASGETKLPEVLRYLRERAHRSSVVFVLSDFLAPHDELGSMARTFDALHHDVTWFHILDPAEMTFPFRERATFTGLEGEPDLDVNAMEARRRYLQEFSNWCADIRDCALEHSIRYRQVPTEESIHQVLASVLA